MIHLNSAFNMLKIVRQETDSIGVALSMGKDSLTTLDLCSQIFPHVEAFYLFRVRGLRVIRKWANYVQKRWGIKVRMYPHWDLYRCYKYAVLQPHWEECRDVSRLTMKDIEIYFRHEANVEWIAYGWRRTDSISRALIMKRIRGFWPETRRVFPIWNWKRSQVYEYLQQNNIPTPPGLGRKEQGGLDFHPGALDYLRKYYPDDWKKWLRDFPFSEIQLLELKYAKKWRQYKHALYPFY
ncbi:MAG: phosphoadenosine phosphosulfate reductase family protein [Nitrososphaerota archaeon]